MGLVDVRPFFRTRLEGLGYEEHDQPFQPGQIGSTIIDGAFHLEIGPILSDAANQTVHGFAYPITVRIYRKGFLNINEAYDSIMGEADTILSDLLDPDIRLGTIIKDIVPESIQPLPLEETNDNTIILELIFTARLQNCYV